jgi:pimeloyl-ACP methyl ester carboxylesterase
MKKLFFLLLTMHLQPLSAQPLLAQPLLAQSHTVFAHGIIDDQTQMHRFSEAISSPRITTVQFCDAQNGTDWSFKSCIGCLVSKILNKPVNPAKMHMGQADDILKLQQAIENCPKEDQIILFGCSRGAATIINGMAENNPCNVQALVLDASPADMPATIKPLLAKIGIHPDYSDLIFKMIFSAYPTDSITPKEAIKKIQNKNLPILLIHSRTDQKVPVEQSYQLYQEFKKQGFCNVELVILPQGSHSYLLQNENMKPLYLQAVHNFYKKYQLPYNSEWTKSDFDWKKYCPENIDAHIQCYEKNILKMYKKTMIKYTTVAAITAIMTTTLFLQQTKD